MGKGSPRSPETRIKIKMSNLRTKAAQDGIDATAVENADLEAFVLAAREARKPAQTEPTGWSDEAMRAAAERMRGRWQDNPEFRQKMMSVKRSFRHSEDFKDGVSKRNRTRLFSHSEEAKRKISRANVERWRRSTFKYKGWVDTEKGGRCGYRSLWEKHGMGLLDRDPGVVRFEYEPFGVPYFLDGKPRFTLPDFLVYMTDGSVRMIEVKPRGFGYAEKTKMKAEACRIFCETRGWTYETWDERDLWPGLSQSEVRDAIRRLT